MPLSTYQYYYFHSEYLMLTYYLLLKSLHFSNHLKITLSEAISALPAAQGCGN